ncbi:MAG: Planctomycete cytochrome, partial [Gemmataceae bacterium]|nr:Planctomycete cytochrome [Gemmataceae bacterium]
GPSFLSEPVRGLQGHSGLHAWRNGDTPAAWVNAGKESVKVWTTLPPRTFYVHPAADGPVGVAWVSPIDGKVRVTGRVADAHKGGGDGVGWQLQHIAADTRADFHKLAAATDRLRQLTRERAEADAATVPTDTAYAVTDDAPHDAELHRRGEPTNRGPAVPRKWLSVLGGQAVPKDGGSGRLALAGWLTDPANPLTARVFVNRVWQYHLGRGIVDTPNDFGTRGGRPSHPELLDWLSAEFVKQGWSVKRLHRQILLSAAYQQSSPEQTPDRDPEPKKTLFGISIPHSAFRTPQSTDADNVWLSRFARRRLTAEEIRDAILAVSGDLDRTPGGPHPFPDEKGWGYTQHNPYSAVYDHDRRSIYLMTQRIKRHPFLGLFDGADPNRSTDRRDTTTVPTQALYFLNDPFVHAKSARLADRLTVLPDPATRLDRLHMLAYGRLPTADERRVATKFLAAYGGPGAGDKDRDRRAWAAWVRVVFASNEFLYVD